MSRYVKPVLVGVDGTRENEVALRWAADEAVSRGIGLHLVYVNPPPPLYAAGIDGYGYATGPAETAAAAETVLTAARDLILAGSGSQPELSTVVVDGHPGAVLVEASAQAALVVVGSRRRGAVGSFLLGSTGAAVATRAACPAVIVRAPDGLPPGQERVVAGVDLSPLSAAVLAYAFDHAHRHALRLRAVLCWNLAASLLNEGVAHDGWSGGRQMLADELSGWREKYPDVVVERAILPSYPSVGLLAEARDSRLLVVGAQNRHPRVATLVGSVTQSVLHHATGPVAVVHADD